MSKTRRTFYYCTVCHAPLFKNPKSGMCRPCRMRARANREMAEATRTCAFAGCEKKIVARNQSGYCGPHAAKVAMRYVPFDAEVESWTPDPAQPERECRRCGKVFTPAGPYNKYFCSPQCQTAANRYLGYAYRMEQGIVIPHRRIMVVSP